MFVLSTVIRYFHLNIASKDISRHFTITSKNMFAKSVIRVLPRISKWLSIWTLTCHRTHMYAKLVTVMQNLSSIVIFASIEKKFMESAKKIISMIQIIQWISKQLKVYKFLRRILLSFLTNKKEINLSLQKNQRNLISRMNSNHSQV